MEQLRWKTVKGRHNFGDLGIYKMDFKQISRVSTSFKWLSIASNTEFF
jgi:hypothetical protein